VLIGIKCSMRLFDCFARNGTLARANRSLGFVSLAVSLLALSCVESFSIGDRILRDYTVYEAMPINSSSARSTGWTIGTTCDPHRGYKATYKGTAPTSSTPISLYFTAAGQIAGIGVNIYGDVKSQLVKAGFYEAVGSSEYFIGVFFRNSSEMSLCSSSVSQDPLGNTLIINPGGVAWPIPLTAEEATAKNWANGSCFYSMGYHYFYDLNTAPLMSWEAANLLPIVPMYNNGVINAFFFATTEVQQGFFSANWWDGIPLINALMCKNWCDSSCTFHDTITWSTMHIYLRDYTQATCPGGCTLSCCPSSY